MAPTPSTLQAATYARARLRLGIRGVGAAVLISILLLALGVPRQLFAGRGGSLVLDASLLAAWLAGWTLAALPIEVLGGYVAPRRFRRHHPAAADWALRWLRGVLAVLVVMSLCGALVILAGRVGGHAAAVGSFGVALLILVQMQGPLSRLIGGMRVVRPRLDAVNEELESLGVDAPRWVVFDARDEGFTGGVSGFPFAETCVLPLPWVARFEPRAVALLIARRTLVVERGLRPFGVAAAIAWTLATFAIASFLPGAGLGDVAGFVTTSLWFTLLSFVGLLILPTPSRAATIAADAWTLREHAGELETLSETLAALDALQDGEPERTAGVESVFHPIPSLASRKRAFDAAQPRTAPWHVARTAVYLSIAGLNPLHRLVHCNVGRPELWVFLPADG